LTGILVGLLLAADDLVLRTPGVAIATFQHVKEIAPAMPALKFNFPQLPSLPALPRFVTRDSGDARNPRMLKPPKPTKAGRGIHEIASDGR
jgi:hypothetical protein